jgi:hypothetical protein
MRIVCLVVAASVLAGWAVYGGLMAMYKLAKALSLSPALTNLVPLVGLGVVWFIVFRFGKYFRLRAERLIASLFPGTGTFERYTEEERRQAWLQIKARGRRRYVWRAGVIGWGLPVFAIFTPLMLIFGLGTLQLSQTKIAALVMSSLLMWILGGYLFGSSMWRKLDEKYR